MVVATVVGVLSDVVTTCDVSVTSEVTVEGVLVVAAAGGAEVVVAASLDVPAVPTACRL